MANSLATTVATPSKCPGRDAPSQTSLTPCTLTAVDGCSGHVGYISRTLGTNTTSTPTSSQHAQVALECPWIVRDVLGVAELQRVDEDAHHDGVALGPRPGHERKVSLVQGTHGRHQADAGAACACRIELRAAGGDGLDELHDRAPQTAAGTTGAVSSRTVRLDVVAGGQARRQGRAGLVGVALVLGQRIEVAAERGPVAPARRTGQRGACPSEATSSTAARVSGKKDSRSSPTEAATRST